MSKPVLKTSNAANGSGSYVKFEELRVGQFFHFYRTWKPKWCEENTQLRKTGKDRAETYIGTSHIMALVRLDRKVCVVVPPKS